MQAMDTFVKGVRYAGAQGQLSFFLHRLTGLGTLLFLVIHILDTSTVYFFPELYNHAIAVYRHPVFLLGEIGLVWAVIYHGVNGLRIILYDLYPRFWMPQPERRGAYFTLGLSIVLWLPAAVLMFRSLVEHL